MWDDEQKKDKLQLILLNNPIYEDCVFIFSILPPQLLRSCEFFARFTPVTVRFF